MTHARTIRFFGDIVSADRINNPPVKTESAEKLENDAALAELMWDALNGRGKRAAEPVKEDRVSVIYFEPVEDQYVDWDAEIEEALKEANVWK